MVVRRIKKPGTGDPLHTKEPVTVASFRTWRGWRENVARDRCLTVSILASGFGRVCRTASRAGDYQKRPSWNFGRGLAHGAKAPVAIWKSLVSELNAAPVEPSTRGGRGFLKGLNQQDPALEGSLLDRSH